MASHNFPPVRFDTTLADLYARGYEESKADHVHGLPKVALLPCGASSDIPFSTTFPRNSKYVYQDDVFMSNKVDTDPQELDRQRHVLAVLFLSVLAQRDAFIAGDMGVVMFSDSFAKSATSRSAAEAEETMSVLPEDQRPRLVFCPGPNEIDCKGKEIDLLAVKVVCDGVTSYDLTVPADTTYHLNSKEALATSGIPTPASKAIELDGMAAETAKCCPACQTNDKPLFMPDNCSGPRRKWLQAQIDRVVHEIQHDHPVPFALKTQQTFGGGGTLLVETEADKSSLLCQLSTHLLPKLYASVTPSNLHLRPATLIISSLIRNPLSNLGLAFFLLPSGLPIYIGVTEQKLADGRQWTGSAICYSDQPALQTKLAPLMHQIAAYLHRHRYYGPVGADILETRSSSSSETEATKYEVVDLNVRLPASLLLGLLRTHFSQPSLNYNNATSLMLLLHDTTRDRFIDALADLFVQGRVVITSWYLDEMPPGEQLQEEKEKKMQKENGLVKDGDGVGEREREKKTVSYACLVVAGEDQERLERDCERVRELGGEIHF